MVPLLDLFNHKRDALEITDLRYFRSEKDGYVHVTAFRKLDIGYVPGGCSRETVPDSVCGFD